MLTPIEVRRIRIEQRRVARLIVDHGGMFISVDGDSEPRRELVARALEVAMRFATPESTPLGPFITALSPAPICHASIVGALLPGAFEAIGALLRAAGYSVA